ncbi:MAG: hypothetical protein JOY64_15910 [Alphaproteobacteria bacterium]|nr:hypothetical protein [Alphaproteobacteria bacterium]
MTTATQGLPALAPNADRRSITERVNVLGRDYNGRRGNTIAIASLPTKAAIGEQHMVNDATATTFWSVAAGGGSNVVPVRWDGASWRIG